MVVARAFRLEPEFKNAAHREDNSVDIDFGPSPCCRHAAPASRIWRQQSIPKENLAMKALLQWLTLQSASIHTLTQFQEQAVALRSVEPERAACLRLLADLASRFVETYDGAPLPAR